MDDLDTDRIATDDRSAICKQLNIPAWVFGYLGRKGWLADVGGDKRQVTAALAALAGDAERLQSFFADAVGAGGQRRQPTSYVRAIERELQKCAADDRLEVQDGRRAHILARRTDWTSLLWPALRQDAENWIRPTDRHLWLHHLRSSQCFAVNLFGPLRLRLAWAKDVWADAFPAVLAVEFEYPLDGDPLNEATDGRTSRTRADIKLDAPDRSWIVEVKFTEPEFGTCSAGRDPRTKNRELSCDAPSMSIEALGANCYLHSIERRYFSLLAKQDSPIDSTKLALHGRRCCPLRHDLYQIVRNLLLVQTLRQERRDVRFAVVAPSANLNPTLHSARGTADSLATFMRSILRDGLEDLVTVVDVESVIARAAGHEDADAREWAAFMEVRYIAPLRAGRSAMRGA
jgi:hypothetical protein